MKTEEVTRKVLIAQYFFVPLACYIYKYRLKTEFYIAQRLSQRTDGAKAGIMERVATIATAVSLAVIIVTLSVVVGFKQNIKELISGATADIVMTAPQSRGVVSSVGIDTCEALDSLLKDERITRVTPFTSKEGVLKNDDNIVGVLLKGVDSLYNKDFYTERLIEGQFPTTTGTPRKKEIMISKRMADKMDVEVGDRIEMVFMDGHEGVLRDRFTLAGIYHTGVDFLDNSYVITDLRNVARLYDGSMITGYDIWLSEGTDSEMFNNELNSRLIDIYMEHGVNAESFTTEQIFPHVFGWLATHDVTAIAVVVIMIIVALLNMTTALLIIVIERQRMIGELRAMGMSSGSVVRLFVYRALFIIIRGIGWGAIIGVALALIQHTWAIIPLPSEGYLLDAVPAALCWEWWLLATAGVVATTLLFMLLPAAFSSRISPAVIMRYE